MARKRLSYTERNRRSLEKTGLTLYQRRLIPFYEGRVSREEARGHSGVSPEHRSYYRALQRRIADAKVSDTDRKRLKRLFAAAKRDKWTDSKGETHGFRRRTSAGETPTAMDLLLLDLSDTSNAEFTLGTSDPTAELTDELSEGEWADEAERLTHATLEDLGLGDYEFK